MDGGITHSKELGIIVENTKVDVNCGDNDLPVGTDIGSREIGERVPLQSQIEEIENNNPNYESRSSKSKDSELYH